jgi:enoyl-CoA hydratase/carnithine racemase
MAFELISVERGAPDPVHVTVTLNHPAKRNALSFTMLGELRRAFTEIGASEATGVILAADGPVFSAGHDFADMAGADLRTARELLTLCTEVMTLIGSIPQVVVAQIHALATAAGCQLIASCDLAVAGASAGFAAPGGKGGLFCHTPMVAIARNVGRKRAAELALTGDVIDAETALQWGLVNQVVPDDELAPATAALLRRATRGSAYSKGLGKATLYDQIDLPQHEAYRLALEVMAAATQTADAQEGMASFVQKRPPTWVGR